MTKVLGGDWKTAEWEVKGFNFAYDGSTTADIFNRLDDLLLLKPDLVISLMGGNDPEFNISVSEHVQNIKKITEKIIDSGSQVVWSNSIPAAPGTDKNTYYSAYAAATMQMTKNENLQLIDMFNLYKKFPLEKFFTFKSEENPVEGLQEGNPDPYHPNQLGNAYIAKVIIKGVFSLEFDPEKYMAETNRGEKYPGY